MSSFAHRSLFTTLVAAATLAASTPATAQPIAPPRLVTDVPAVLADDGLRAEAEKARPVQLGHPDPERFAPPGPARAAAEFLAAWHDRAWDRMALWSTGDAAALRATYAVDRLRGWTFVDRRRGEGAAAVEVLVARRGMRPVLTRGRVALALVRDPGGRWRVVAPGV